MLATRQLVDQLIDKLALLGSQRRPMAIDPTQPVDVATGCGALRPSSRWIAGTSRLSRVSGRQSTVSADGEQPILRASSADEIPARSMSARTPRFHASSTVQCGPFGRRCAAMPPQFSTLPLSMS